MATMSQTSAVVKWSCNDYFVKNLALNGLGMSEFAVIGHEMTVFQKNPVLDGLE